MLPPPTTPPLHCGHLLLHTACTWGATPCAACPGGLVRCAYSGAPQAAGGRGTVLAGGVMARSHCTIPRLLRTSALARALIAACWDDGRGCRSALCPPTVQ